MHQVLSFFQVKFAYYDEYVIGTLLQFNHSKLDFKANENSALSPMNVPWDSCLVSRQELISLGLAYLSQAGDRMLGDEEFSLWSF